MKRMKAGGEKGQNKKNIKEVKTLLSLQVSFSKVIF